MDVNTACTSFLYGLSTATAMIRSGVVRNALVIGAELISPFMDWTDRNVAVLFGDGAAAVVLQATDREEGLLAEKLGCYGEAREILRVHGMGGRYANQGVLNGVTRWQFEGQEIFKRAVHGMGSACEAALGKVRATGGRCRPGRAAPGEPAHHRGGGQARARADGARVRERAALRKHVIRDGARGALRSARRRTGETGRTAADARIRRRPQLLRARRAVGRTRDAPACVGGGVAAERAHGARADPRRDGPQDAGGRRNRKSYFFAAAFFLRAGSFGRDLPNEPL